MATCKGNTNNFKFTGSKRSLAASEAEDEDDKDTLNVQLIRKKRKIDYEHQSMDAVDHGEFIVESQQTEAEDDDDKESGDEQHNDANIDSHNGEEDNDTINGAALMEKLRSVLNENAALREENLRLKAQIKLNNICVVTDY